MFAKPKSIRHAFITDDAFRVISMIAARRGANETGGPLVGYASTDHALVIVDVAGPGPQGICLPNSVTIDGAYATAFCANASHISSGQHHYLGDWHVHNADNAEPSPRDFVALKKLPATNAWGYPTISLILSAKLDYYVCLCRIGRKFTFVECAVLPTSDSCPLE
ncbi:MAG: Mov34/MPN/PAD-1 family protein [Verrucomicrobiota bacterium]